MRQLTVDPEFRDKIPPLSADEYSRLEANILEDGEVREPIVVWGNTIIDGHNRWKIIQAHTEIPFKVKQMNFADKWDAIAWMCRNQLGRRNLTDVQKTILQGEAYKARKLTVGGDRKSGDFSSAQNEHLKERTADKVAKDFGVARETIKRSEKFLDGLNAAEEASPGIKEAVLSGSVKAHKSTIAGIRNMPEQERKEAAEAIMRGEPIKKKPETNRIKHSESTESIRAAADSLRDTERTVEHTVEDLEESLSLLADDFISKVRRNINIYKEDFGVSDKEVVGSVFSRVSYELNSILDGWK